MRTRKTTVPLTCLLFFCCFFFFVRRKEERMITSVQILAWNYLVCSSFLFFVMAIALHLLHFSRWVFFLLSL
uniref:Uncharacterized protein n=1 Tax=Rhizophora mucronata TaxID=61149 RepID=A0A2P2QEK0_RHIMU